MPKLSLLIVSSKFNSVDVQHPSGDAEINQISIEQKKPFQFSANLKVKHFDLQKLFVSLNLLQIPVDLSAQADAQCRGQLLPIQIQCDSQIVAKNLKIRPSIKNSFHIVELNSAKASGTVDFTAQKFNFKALLELPGLTDTMTSSKIQRRRSC